MVNDLPKEILGQVQQELLLTLYKNARKLLQGSSPPDTNNPNFQDLVLVLDTVAKQNFQKQYGYEYKGNQSKPKETNVKNLSSSDGLFNISRASGPQIVNDVQILLNNTNTTGTGFEVLDQRGLLRFKSPVSGNWNTLPYTKIDDEPADKNPCYSDVEMLEVTIDDQGAKYTFIYYVGVYYEKMSGAALENKLLRVLLDNAKKLPSAAAIPSAGTATIQQIQSVLLGAAKAKFLADYQVPYKVNATKPGDLATGKAKDVRGIDNIYCLQDSSGIPALVETSLLSAIEFGRNDVKFAKKEAIATLTKQLTDMVKNSTDNSWLYSNFNYTYGSTNLTENSVKVISVVLYSKSELKEGQFVAKATFISFLGVYYHIVAPEGQAAESRLENLYGNASRLCNPPKHVGPPYTTQGLRDILDSYADEKFKQVYGVDFSGDETQPKDEVKPNDIKRLTSTQNTLVLKDPDWNILDIIIKVQITDGFIIPDWLIEPTTHNLQKALLAAHQLSVDGSVQSARISNVYQDPNDNNDQWKSIAILVFTSDAVQDGGVKVTQSFLNFTGAFYPIQPLKALAEPLPSP